MDETTPLRPCRESALPAPWDLGNCLFSPWEVETQLGEQFGLQVPAQSEAAGKKEFLASPGAALRGGGSCRSGDGI